MIVLPDVLVHRQVPRQEITLGEAGGAVVGEKSSGNPPWRLAAPTYHHRRDRRIGAAADRGQRCRLAVGCLQGLGKARQSSPKHVASPKRTVFAKRIPAEACASPKPRTVKLAALGPVSLEPPRRETDMRSREIPDRRGCGTYRRIGRRDQRPQRRRVRLQSAACAADRGEIEGRRLCRDQVARDRGQGQAQPLQACRRGQRSVRESLPVDPP